MNQKRFTLYHIFDRDGEFYIAAECFNDALKRWIAHIKDENHPWEGDDPKPDSVTRICEHYELLLPEG